MSFARFYCPCAFYCCTKL